MSRVPFNRPFLTGKELHYISQAVQEGHLAGDGRFTKQCQAWLEQRTGAAKVLLTHSCTAALEMSALLYDIGPGDEMIMPSFTFVSTANAFALRGATPVFVDIREDTLNLDARLVEAAITDRTRAIVAVHYAGVGCDMDALAAIAETHGLALIEDAAQGVNATRDGRQLGSIGSVGCWSFHETKNVISGEGGAIAINDPALIERAERIRDKGTNRSQFFRGEVDRYSWVELGSSFLPSELTAAFLWAQLEAADATTERRRAIAARYQAGLQDLEDRGVLRGPVIPEGCEPNGHMHYVLANSPAERDGLIAHLKQRDIHAVFHYVPLHSAPHGLRVGRASGELAVTTSSSERLLRLPCYYDLSAEDQARVIAAVQEFFG